MPIRSTTTKPVAEGRRIRDASPDAHTSARASSPAPRAKKEKDAFEGGFASHYPHAKKVPTLDAATVATFDEAQVQALHRAYWKAPATASLGDMAALAFKDPAFKGRKLDQATEKQIGRVIERFPESFPWGWRSRVLAATSCKVVGALVRAPAGTSFKSIVADLQKEDPQFPTVTSFNRAAREVWPAEPERFPFAKLLAKKDGAYVLEARGAVAIRKDGFGRFAMNEALAKKVAELTESPVIEYGWTKEDFAKYVDDELQGGGAFTARSLDYLRTSFPKIVPDFMQVRMARRDEIARTIHELYTKEGVDTAEGLIQALHERLGTPLWKTSMLTWFRNQYPDLVPNLKADKADAAYADARALLDAILAAPDTPRLHVGKALGHSEQRVGELFTLIKRRWPDELEVKAATPFSKEDVKALRQAMADVPLNATMRDLMDVLEREHPQFLERHPYASTESLYSAVYDHGGAQMEGGWNALQQRRYVEVFVDAVKRSPPGTSFKEIVNVLLDEHEGAYTLSSAKRLVTVASTDAPPAAVAKLAALRDKDGKFPWDKSKVRLTHALAQRVAKEIEARPGARPIDVARALMRDETFAKEHPTFSQHTVHHLRARYPTVVPYVDDPPPGAAHGKRREQQKKELLKIAKDVAKHVDGLDDTRGLTIAGLARATGHRPHRVLNAIRQAPELFPWYRERPTGRVDLHLAARVGRAIELAPLGTTLEQVVDELRADPSFRERWPQFNYFSVSKLRERYPELVPEVHARSQILRSKLLVEALLVAKKGTPYEEVFAKVSDAHPGGFPAQWSQPDYVKALWQGNPERFPYARALSSASGALQLTGRGEKPGKLGSGVSDEVASAMLAKLEQIPESLRVLDKIVDGIKSKPFEDTEILAIQHLLGPQVAMFDAARKLGMVPGRASIVGIPYSVSDTVVDTLNDKGWDVRVPPLDLDAWYDMVAEAMQERIDSSLKHGNRKIVVFDDGGLVPMMFERHPELAEHAHLFRIVEQTTRGITVADGVDLRSPVVNVAQSWAKFVEGPMVGSTVQKKLLKRLAGLGVDGVKGKHIGVTGFGTVGAPLAEFLRDQGAKVTVLDMSADALARAKAAGFDVADGTDAKARAKFFGKQDILVGATGKQSMTADDIEHMKDGAILGSSSSKLVEIDVETLKALTKRGKLEVVDAESFPPTVRYHLKDGRTIDLLASGFPMNFDGSVEDVAAERIQLTMGLMLAGALQAAGVSAAGLHRLDPSIQIELMRAFHDDVGGSLDGEQGAAVAGAMSVAQAHLAELEKKHGAREHDLRHRR